MSSPSKWFKAREFECRCGKCGLDQVHERLLNLLDKTREQLGVPLRINSGVRCGEGKGQFNYNQQIGGTSNSAHLPYSAGKGKGRGLVGLAADVTYSASSQRSPLNMTRLWLALEANGRPVSLGLGLYPSFVHVDVRGIIGKSAARWEDKYFPWPR